MKCKIKFIVLVLFCLCFFQITALAQSNPTDEINRLEKEKQELLKELEVLKEINARKAENERLREEVKKLRSGQTDNTVAPLTTIPATSPQNTVNPQSIPQPVTTNNTPRGSTTVQNPPVQSKCVQLGAATELDKNICEIAKVALNENAGKINYESSLSEVSFLYATALKPEIAKDAESQLLYDSEKKRTDKQVGAASSNSGTTSLVVKGGAPAIIGWAVENGSMTSSIDGNTVTLRLNPYNFANAFFGQQGLYQIKDETDSQQKDYFEEFLKRLNLGFSFDTSRGTDTPTFIVSKQQLASWSARYEFINRRNPLSDSKNMTEMREAYFASQAPKIDAVTQAVLDLDTNPVLRPISDDFITKVNNDLELNLPDNCKQNPSQTLAAAVFEGCRDKIYEIINQHLATFPAAEVAENEAIVTQFRSLMKTRADFRKRREEFLNEVNKGMVATFEYTNNREVNAPDTSNFRFIVEKGVFASKKFLVDFTVNAELTMFNKKPTGANVKRIKDFNFAFQMDAPLNDIMLFNDSVLSFAFRYTRLASDVVLPNGVVANGTKGDILFGQAKLTVPIGNFIRLPLSFTFGNRSEFIKERFTRTNFGLTFDLDQLFKPFKDLDFFK
jgi:hypothetical protein